MQKKCRLCRREGVKLFLKGERCFSQKCALKRRNYPPGAGPDKRFSKNTDYGKQLREKQKARRIFGISEKQLRRCYRAADRSKNVTGNEILRLLEMRLDNVIFRSGLAASRSQARQMVSHKIFVLNGVRVNIPSMQVKVGDQIEVSKKHKKIALLGSAKERKDNVSRWLETDFSKLNIAVKDQPAKEDFDTTINAQVIVVSKSSLAG